MSKEGSAALVRERDDWLGGHFAGSQHGSNAKLTSKLVKDAVKRTSEPSKPAPAEKQKKAYQLQVRSRPHSDRRKSWSAPETPKAAGNKSPMASSSIVPLVEALPERVNAIRDTAGGQPQVAGHFVLEHRNSRDHLEGGGSPSRADDERRCSLDYDEIEAVKQRISHAAAVWQQNGSNAAKQTEVLELLEVSGNSFHGDILPSRPEALQYPRQWSAPQTVAPPQASAPGPPAPKPVGKGKEGGSAAAPRLHFFSGRGADIGGSVFRRGPSPAKVRPHSFHGQLPTKLEIKKDKVPSVEKPSSSGKGWLLGKWLSRFSKNRTPK